jgi:hypothetical protein
MLAGLAIGKTFARTGDDPIRMCLDGIHLLARVRISFDVDNARLFLGKDIILGRHISER